MNELIKIDYSNDRPAVSARELHEFLEVGADYRHWFPRMCEYGFAEGQDFNPVKIDRVQDEGGRMVTRTVEDAALSIEMAKEICMLQRNEKGKQARQYFIQLEKDWNSPEKVMARALQVTAPQIRQLQQLQAALEEWKRLESDFSQHTITARKAYVDTRAQRDMCRVNIQRLERLIADCIGQLSSVPQLQ